MILLSRFEMLRALRQRNYRLWAASDFLSVAGTWMQILGVNWLLLSLSHSATSLGLGLFLQSIPTLLLAMLGGSLADRLPVRPMVFTGQILHATLASVLAVIAFTGAGGVWTIYAICLLVGSVTAISTPAIGRFGAETVGREDLSNGLALGSVISSGGRILGIGLAGMIIPVTGSGVMFVINALTFGSVILAVLRMRTAEFHPLRRSTRERAGVREGLRYLRATPWLLVVFGVSFILGALGRNYQLTMAAMSEGPLHSGAGGYGVLSVVFAVGAILGGVFAASRRKLTLRLLFTAATMISVALAISSAAPGLWSFAALMLPIAAGAVLVDTTLSTRIQLDTEDGMRGRVLAAQTMVGAAAGASGGPLVGVLCDAIGPRTALLLAGTITTVVCLAGAVIMSYVQGRRLPTALPSVLPGVLPALVPSPRRPAGTSAHRPAVAMAVRPVIVRPVAGKARSDLACVGSG